MFGGMIMTRVLSKLLVCLLLAGLSFNPSRCPAQDKQERKQEAPSPNNRITIEVTAGDANKPVENASVYVKTIEEHALKDKKSEVNVKTNQEGVAHVPDAPLGKVLIQVVADGWKPYGHWYDITDPKQVIKIHLERPPKWY
jgi:hypothetical protein